MVENRRVGIKSRETYECPGSLAVLLAHADLESITLERDLMREKARLEPRYAELVYDGLWYSPLKEALDAFMAHAQRFVTGEVRLRLEPGRVLRRPAGAPTTASTATTSPPTTPSDTFRHEDSAGFVRLWGLSVETWAREQGRPRGGRPIERVGPTDTAHVTLWHGRFADGPADELLAFTESLSFDRRLAPDDLAGSRAHVAGLAARGSAHRRRGAPRSLAALDAVGAELADGTFAFAPSDEDIHTAIERRVTELAGAAGAKLHTGRSRNDQVATALRLFVRREGADRRRARPPAPGGAASSARRGPATSTCRATRTSSGHSRCSSRTTSSPTSGRSPATSTAGATRSARADVSPLGAGALAGSSLPLDPDGDRAPTSGSPGASTTRSTRCPTATSWPRRCSSPRSTQVHLSRLGEEIVLWTSEEFGFLRLADAYSTGSSMLPQKKNPDIAELARGKAGRLHR